MTTNIVKLNVLREYCFTQFRDINLILREEIKTKQDFDEKYREVYGEGTTSERLFNTFLLNIELLDELFEDCKINQEIVVYRKFSSKNFSKFEVGHIFTDQGFISTCVNKDSLKNVLHSDVLSYDSIATIIVKKDTPCVYIGDVFGRKESELLLTRNLKFKVTSKKNNEVQLEIV